jgi:hypothetical protein
MVGRIFVMGVVRIISELDFRRVSEIIKDYRRGWRKEDLESLSAKLDDPEAYQDGMLRLTMPEYLALPELNRENVAKTPQAKTSPLLVWVQDQGLFSAIRKH